MTDQTGAPGGEAITSVELPADAPESFSSVSEAAAYYTSLKEKKPAEGAGHRNSEPDTATAENELAQANDGPETVPAEEPEGDDPAELPPIERPRSWSKDDDDDWNALPRARQEKIAANERARETDINQRINKAAETAKAAEAKAAQAEQSRQQYEARQLAPLDQVAILEYEQRQKFPDIKSMEDLQRISAEATRLWPTDPITAGQIQAYLGEWRTHQDAMAIAMGERNRIEGQRETVRQQAWAKHVQDEMALATKDIPELADQEKAAVLIGRAEKEFLPSLGFKKAEIDAMSIGVEKLSIFDHRVLRMISDGMKYADIQKAKTAVAAKPVPPVQRPGPARPAGNVDSERIQALNRKPELTVKEATELYELQQRSQRRRA